MCQMAHDSWLNVSINAENSLASHQTKQPHIQAPKVQLIGTSLYSEVVP